MGPGAAGAAGDHGHRDCLTSADHGCFQRHQTSDTARLPAAPEHPAHQRARHRPDLHAPGQLGPVCHHRAGSTAVSLVQQPGGGLRHCGVYRHADHHHTDLLRDPLRLEVPAVAVSGCHRHFLCGGLCLFCLQHDEAVCWRLVSAGHWRRDFHADDHLEKRP